MLLNKEKIFEKVINLIDTKGFNCKKIKEFSSNESQQLENLILFLNNQKSTNNIAVLLNTDTCSLSFLSTPISDVEKYKDNPKFLEILSIIPNNIFK